MEASGNKPKSIIIWIDPNVDNEENSKYRKELDCIGYVEVQCFKNTKGAINYLKQVQFIDTKIIVSDSLYIEFLDLFIINLKEINVIPKIIIFTNQKELFISQNEKYKEYLNHSYYNYGGIKTSFEEIKNFILNRKQEKSEKIFQDNIKMTFEDIDQNEKLLLPLFYKMLLEETNSDKIENYTNFIYQEYSKENENIKNLMTQIKSLENIPIELLSKYFIRAYTFESKFYNDINRDLLINKREKHLIFVKTLYESTKLKSLPLASNNELYRGAKISNDEINNIKEYLNKKLKNLPAAIVFSKSFVSFTKDREIAEGYLEKKNNNDNLSKVLYILEKDNNLDYSLATHADIEKISFILKKEKFYFINFLHLK